MTTEAAKAGAAAKPKGLLDAIDMVEFEGAASESALYRCGIRDAEETRRFDLQIRVGSAVFGKTSFWWQGKGENAQQVQQRGMIQNLTLPQLRDVREKLRYRFLRVTRNGDGEVVGVQDIDVSDLGSTDPADVKAPKLYRDRKKPGDLPLKDFLTIEPVVGNPMADGKVLSAADLRALADQQEAEEQRLQEAGSEVFELLEAGKGGKAASAVAARDEKKAVAMTTSTATRKGEAGFIPGK